MADMMETLQFLTMEEYLWGYSSSFIRLMAYDKTRIKYLKKGYKKSSARAFKAEDVLASLGAERHGQLNVSGQKSALDMIRDAQKNNE